MLEKARPPKHRINRANSQEPAGLSEGRLALVQRYMIDADEAAAGMRATVERDDARLDARARDTARTVSVAEEQARFEAAERQKMRLQIERRRVATAQSCSVHSESAVDTTGETVLHRPSGVARDASPIAIGEVAPARNGVVAKEEARTVQDRARADKRAAKLAARRIAALKKQEAQERRALAKAAARRRRS